MSQKSNFFSFSNQTGKWSSMISGKVAYQLYSNFGIPEEVLVDEVSRVETETRLWKIMNDWMMLVLCGYVEPVYPTLTESEFKVKYPQLYESKKV